MVFMALLRHFDSQDAHGWDWPGVYSCGLFMTRDICCEKAKYGSVAPFSRSISYSFENGAFGRLLPAYNSRWIYSGIFSPTEAAAVAVFYSLLIGVFVNEL